MSSNINPYNINGAFPVAGQDNPSQGFRDNFTNIKNNFLFAQSEINDLQGKVLVTRALNGQSVVNDMNGTIIYRPQLGSWTQTLYDLRTVSGTVSLDFNQANFQKMVTGAPITLDFINWPTSTGQGALGYGLMRVWIRVPDVAHTVTLPTNVSVGVLDIAGYSPDTTAITFDAPGDYIFDFSSIDSGTSYLIFDVTRNRSTFRDPGIYYNNEVNSTLLIGYHDGLPTALQLEAGQDSISTRGSYNSVSAGNLSLANVTLSQLDTGGLSGYSVSSARGSITTGNPADIMPVESGDYLGYFNSIAMTGNGTPVIGNTFQQMSSINFFATGTDYTNGLGGNIAFFTSVDGGAVNRVVQAIGIENDQSTHLFGNLDVTKSAQLMLDTGANVVFNNFSGEIIVNRIDSGNVYKFLVGGGRVCAMASTDTAWTYANSTPTANAVVGTSASMEFLDTPPRYVFTNLGAAVEHHLFGIKTRNGA